jgi:hypothetical protein
LQNESRYSIKNHLYGALIDQEVISVFQNLLNSPDRLFTPTTTSTSLVERTYGPKNAALELMFMLREKCYQMFLEFRRPTEGDYRRAVEIVARKKQAAKRGEIDEQLPIGHDTSKTRILSLLLAYFAENAKSMAIYAKQLPGFYRLCDQDLYAIVFNSTMAVLSFKTERLFIDGEHYTMLADDVQCSKYLMYQVNDLINPHLNDHIFAYYEMLLRLKLTDYELALLAPLVLSSPGENKNDMLIIHISLEF